MTRTIRTIAILEWGADRVQSSGFNRQTRLIMLNRCHIAGVVQKTESACQGDSNNTNRFTDLARLADRVQTYECNRRARLIILNR
eukprot:259263-Pyramimonas_sp.AAC.1